MAFNLQCLLITTICYVSLTRNQVDCLCTIRENFPQYQEPPDANLNQTSEYDFVVVGAGSAGSVVAARLSEIPEVTVLLIEAGGPQTIETTIPFLWTSVIFNKDLNWMYKSVPSDDYCLAYTNHQCNLPRGKVMGGSSSINAMIATRGHRRDYDNWAKQNPGWSYDEIMPYFKKLENLEIPELRNNTAVRGTKGPVCIGYTPYRSVASEVFLNASIERGYRQIDYNANLTRGYARTQTTTSHGIRQSASTAYLHPIKNRKNLIVTKRSLASKILIDPTTKCAKGAEFTKNGVRYVAKAKKEVILSAGSIGSPQLLMLSGVGHREHLTNLGIDVIADLPVGDNFQDHPSYSEVGFYTDTPVMVNTEDIMNSSNPYIKEYFTQYSGPLSNQATEALGFLDVDNPEDEDIYPNIEQLVVSFSRGDRSEPKYLWSIFPVLLRPKSRGWLRLASADIKDKPLVTPNYYSDPDDVRVMVKGVRNAIAFRHTRVVKESGSVMSNDTIAGCGNYEPDSDEYLECAIRTYTYTFYHYCGTCKMGPKEDKTAVVDATLKVIGLNGLRVVDSSIIPVMPAAHLNLPTMMIAERASDLIKRDWGYGTDPLP